MSNSIYVPVVTVVVRTKDRPLLLNRALNSLARQSFDDFEVVIVNDGGDPAKLNEVLKYYNHLDCHVQNNVSSVGRARAFNMALAIGKGELVCCLDDDDTYEQDFLSKAVLFYQEAKRRDGDTVGMVCRSYEIMEVILPGDAEFDFRTRVKTTRTLILPKFNGGDKVIRPYAYFMGDDNFLPVQTMFDRKLVMELGGFDEMNDVLEDRPLYTKILNAGKIRILDEFLVNHHSRETAVDPNHVNSMSVDHPSDWSEPFSNYHQASFYGRDISRVFFYGLFKEALERGLGIEHKRALLEHFVTKFPIYFVRFMRKKPLQFGLFFAALTIWSILIVALGSGLAIWWIGN